jgi:osmoprotectant transport system ATP-binding protein
MISLHDLQKTYAGRPALDNVSVDIERGSFVALVGQSGAGKTTLLKAINRLVDVDSGAVHVDGQDVATLSNTELRRKIGYVFQGVGLFPHMTAAENIWMVPRLQGQASDGRDARVAELLALVSLPQNIAARYPAQLSGGQAQRVGVARALAARPSIMLMDEPFGALDPVTRSELGNSYRALHESAGLTTVMVTHDMAEAVLLADRVIVLAQGRIAADMVPAELMAYRGDAAISAMIATVRDQAARLEQLARAGQ